MSVSHRYSYADAEQYLRSLELFGMRFGLERMRRLMTALDSPHERFRSIQVVGTNGKSSTARMTAALLERHGVRAGAYLSPHLGSFAERIEVGGQPSSKQRFAAAVGRAAKAAELVDRGLEPGDQVTQFEALTAAAYRLLAESGVEVAVVEAGLGGRYDATSVIRADVLVVTNVGLEHTRWLGPSERHIAEEKLAVVPTGGTLVSGPLGPDALAVAERVIDERGAELRLLGRDFAVREGEGGTFAVQTPLAAYDEIALAPLGAFQHTNFAVAVSAAEAFLGRLGAAAVRKAAAALRLPGRLEVVSERPLVVLDGAHNPSAARALRPSLQALLAGRELVAVVSVLDDKDAAGILGELLSLARNVVFTRSSNARALPPAVLESLNRQLSGPASEVVTDPVAALARARALAGRDGAVLVTGSIYLLSDLVRARSLGSSEVA